MNILFVHLGGVNHWSETVCLPEIFKVVHNLILLKISLLVLVVNKVISFIIDDDSILLSIALPICEDVMLVMLVC